MGQPQSNNRKSYLSAAVLALVASGAGGTYIATQYISEKEGLSLSAYQDGARVWTDCFGRTEGVRKGDVSTRKECTDWLAGEVGKRMEFIHSVVEVPQTEPAWAGLTSWCFNIGTYACEHSQAVRLINAGRQAQGCKAILLWRYITRDGKKIDCSTEQPYCSGLWDRRNGEAELCSL